MTKRARSSKQGQAPSTGHARVKARANIALGKYWGKADIPLNLPAVPSISMTLDRLVTETSVTLDASLAADHVSLDGRVATAKEATRVVELLGRVRDLARPKGAQPFARVVSENRFPTAAGLASSASGFAALAAAATRAYGVERSDKQLSAMARRSSASAARSVFGGFVELPAGDPSKARADSLAAKQLHDVDHWDLRIVVAQTAVGEKEIGSTTGMERSRTTSPFYEAWVDAAPKLNRTVRGALRRRDLDKLGPAMEQSTLSFHACAMASAPGILYFRPPTLAALATVRGLRDKRGISVWATMDAGPHVKALCHADDAAKVQRALRKTEGVLATLVSGPGPGLEWLT